MLFTTSVAVLGFASYASAHMIMATPVPYGKATLNNSPLAADGSDFPCKQRSGVYESSGVDNSMALGASQPLSFTGSATHGGGSCQVSITYDMQPTKSSTFKVIHSIEGGCPIKGVAGNNGDNANEPSPDTYSFTIPSNIPTGNATLAWTWFNKVGNREMYMNCAPVALSGSSSKRDESGIESRDTSAYDALPDMFVANIGNGCGTVDSTDLLFPAPGDSVEQDGQATKSALSTPTGSACGSAVSASVAPTAGSESGASSAPAATTAAPAAPSAAGGGGVFATVAASSGTPTVPTSASAASAAPVSASSAAAASAVAPAPSASSGSGGSGSAMTAGSACTAEGEWNCIGTTSFQRCASGQWSVAMSVAAGTTCTSGLGTSLNVVVDPPAKRRVRFSGEHLRRHLQQSN
ncbi:MAG: hypothetical protein M1818_005586 [Claussenomyces sp. TS43310]|nr:MAG: hypothetical protein M1818_005586 [Claussenomyces sp. TS43310]